LKPSYNTLSRIRVPAGFVLAAIYFNFSRPTWKSLWLGGAVAFLGILIRTWATGHLNKDDRLAVTGPYAFTRNPLYFGSFIIGLGFSLAGENITMLVVFLACFAVLYGPVMQLEMNHLREKFPVEYSRYQASVPLFFPHLWPHQLEKGRFSFHRYFKNKEYQALVGFLAAVGLLVFKIRTS
jgi:protein-S-isoprenylcysteine O-methyltransferase Ste14